MAGSNTVTLRGGLVVSVAALQVGWSLEDRGFTLRPSGDGLLVTPPEQLTREDAALIRQHRDELLALAKYSDEVVL